jgi:hypothetical protein
MRIVIVVSRCLSAVRLVFFVSLIQDDSLSSWFQTRRTRMTTTIYSVALVKEWDGHDILPRSFSPCFKRSKSYSSLNMSTYLFVHEYL